MVMELIQVNWDDKENLFLKFKKDRNEQNSISSESIKNLNLKYSISKLGNRGGYSSTPPYLISVKDFYDCGPELGFSVELDEISEIDDLQIDIMSITMNLESGKRKHIAIREQYALSEIPIDDSCYIDFFKKLSQNNPNTEIIIKEEKSITIKTINNQEDKRKNVIPVRNLANPESIGNKNEEETIIISKSKYETIRFLLQETRKRLNDAENELKEANDTVRKLALKNADTLQNIINNNAGIQLVSLPQTPPPPQLNPPKARTLAPKTLEGPPKRINQLALPNNCFADHSLVIEEMKEKFQNMKDLNDILKKVPKDVLNRDIPRTDRRAYIKFKTKNEIKN